MGDATLIGLGGQQTFLEGLVSQLSKDMGMLLGRRGDVKKFEWSGGGAQDRWMAARFEVRSAKGEKLGLLELSMARKPAVLLAADLVRAPNTQTMVTAGPLSDMVADGLREAANVSGAALARVFKQPMGGAGTCHLVLVAWDAEVPAAPKPAWHARFELAFTGMKESVVFELVLEA